MTSVVMGWTTSASTKKVAVSDQLVAEMLIVRPSRAKPDKSSFVKGQGPAIQEARAFRNSLPGPASSETWPTAAFHLPSGEHGRWPAQGMFLVFTASNDRTALPMVATVPVLMEYLTSTFFFSSRRRHTTSTRDWSSDVCSSD